MCILRLCSTVPKLDRLQLCGLRADAERHVLISSKPGIPRPDVGRAGRTYWRINRRSRCVSLPFVRFLLLQIAARSTKSWRGNTSEAAASP